MGHRVQNRKLVKFFFAGAWFGEQDVYCCHHQSLARPDRTRAVLKTGRRNNKNNDILTVSGQGVCEREQLSDDVYQVLFCERVSLVGIFKLFSMQRVECERE